MSAQTDAFFKIKPSKKGSAEERTTLDVLHQYQVNKIKTEKESVDEIQEQIRELEQRLESTTDDLTYGQIEQQIEALHRDLESRTQDDKLFSYFLDTGDLLFQYYEIQDAISKGASVSKNQVKRKPGDVLSALEDAAKENDETQTQTNQVEKVAEQEKTLNRDKLLEQYLTKLNPAHRKKVTDADQALGECEECGKDMIFAVNEAMLYCKECGTTEFILIDSDRPSYKDPPRESSYYAYKRINHFNELLAQFQAKGTSEIPQEIFDTIVAELKKQKITDPSKIKQEKIREILRKLRLNKYYDNIPHILSRLNGSSAPIMDRDTEERLRHMFKEIQPSFQKHCPKNRRNFLSYAYVMYKFCELLELDDFLKNFHLLKNRDKLYLQDKIWKLICEDQGWEFIRSI